MTGSPKLTHLAHGSGCGCKLSPQILDQLLGNMPRFSRFPDLLVGNETRDDAAVFRLDDEKALVATTDFFTPIVDDPYDFGRIAAANALSDIYSMGAKPIMALAIFGFPVATFSMENAQRVLAGGAAICEEAGIPIAGGHSIDSVEPLYGLSALGIVNPKKILRNSSSKPGDSLILSKGLGIGVFSAALKRGDLPSDLYPILGGELIKRIPKLL